MPKNFRSLRSRSCFLVEIQNYFTVNEKFLEKLSRETSTEGEIKVKTGEKKEKREKRRKKERKEEKKGDFFCGIA